MSCNFMEPRAAGHFTSATCQCCLWSKGKFTVSVAQLSKQTETSFGKWTSKRKSRMFSWHHLTFLRQFEKPLSWGFWWTVVCSICVITLIQAEHSCLSMWPQINSCGSCCWCYWLARQNRTIHSNQTWKNAKGANYFASSNFVSFETTISSDFNGPIGRL